MSSYKQDLRSFMVICDSLLELDLDVVKLTNEENRLIQFYISTLAAKFPAMAKQRNPAS